MASQCHVLACTAKPFVVLRNMTTACTATESPEVLTQIINGEEVDVPPPGWKMTAGSKYRGVSRDKKNPKSYRAYVIVHKRGMVSAGTFSTEYAAAKAVAALSRELQHELPYTIPDGLVTIPKWVMLTYECPHCKQLMHSDPNDGFCPRYAAHVRECRKGGTFYLTHSARNASTSKGHGSPCGSANIGDARGKVALEERSNPETCQESTSRSPDRKPDVQCKLGEAAVALGKGFSKPCCEGDQEEESVDDENLKDCSATAGGLTIPCIDRSDFSDQRSSCSSDGNDDDVGSSSGGSGGGSGSFGKPLHPPDRSDPSRHPCVHAYAPFPTGTPACRRCRSMHSWHASPGSCLHQHVHVNRYNCALS